MNRKKFYTMMENLENVHLIKDVGMFPYVLQKEGYFDSYIVGYGVDECDLKYLCSTIKGVKYVKRKKITGNSIMDGIVWLVGNSKKIDILNLYHYKKSTFIWILIYKLFNPKGKVYVKLDIDPADGMRMTMKRNTIKYFVTKYILGMASVISCETRTFKEYAENNWPINVQYIPNAIMKEEINCNCKKENIIISVGRMGTQQKATEILLDAFESVKDVIDSSWKLVLVGSVEKNFEQRLYSSLDKCEGRIEYKGVISDRKELSKLYERSKIFTIPSRGESFGIAALEAISKGDYLLTTDLISFKEISNNGQFGDFFPIDDVNAYADKIIITCKKVNGEHDVFNKIALKEYLNGEYSYESVCKKLFNLLQD